MTYRVIIMPRAKHDARAIARWISEDSPLNASRWFDRLTDAVKALRELPGRCPLAAEDSDHPIEIRQLLFGDYRVLFTIAGQEVHVLHVRHASRRPGFDQ